MLAHGSMGPSMPAYDYRCLSCGREIEISHPIRDSVTTWSHADPRTGAACFGALERLISLVGVNPSLGTRPLDDQQIAGAGFTKYVRGSKGYEKAAGPAGSPDYIPRE